MVRRLSGGGNRIRTVGPASGKVVDAKFQRSDPGRSNTDFWEEVLSLPWRAETSNSRRRAILTVSLLQSWTFPGMSVAAIADTASPGASVGVPMQFTGRD